MAKKILEVKKYKQFFTVKLLDKAYQHNIDKFLEKLTTNKREYVYKLKRTINVPDKTYASYDIKDKTYRIIGPLFDIFFQFTGIPKGSCNIEEPKQFKHIQKRDIRIRKEFQIRDRQRPLLAALSKGNRKCSTRLLKLQTGGGKTFVALQDAATTGEMVAVSIMPKYINRWIEGILETTHTTIDKILVLKGGDSIRDLQKKIISKDVDYDFVIFSNSTMMGFIKEWTTDKGDIKKYLMNPQEFFERLGVGLLIFDEVHQELYKTFIQMCYFNVKKVVALSATFGETRNAQILRMNDLLFPKDCRIIDTTFHKYIILNSIHYEFHKPRDVRCKTVMGYSHTEFENYIMRRRDMLDKYVAMIYISVRDKYVRKRKDGDKTLIFAATKKMCTILRDRLQAKFNDLNVTRYVEEDDYDESVNNSDMIISTLISAGTALDIANLTDVFQTVNVMSADSNLQSIGRLRFLGKGRDVNFYYFTADNISKHMEYHLERRNIWRDKVAVINKDKYPLKI